MDRSDTAVPVALPCLGGQTIDALAANFVLTFAGLHGAAALFHHDVLRDGVLRRMLPRG